MSKRIIKYLFLVIISALPFFMLLMINSCYPKFPKNVMFFFERITHNRDIAAIISMLLFYALPVFVLLKIYEYIKKR
ncbi:hypothetical protein [Treponema sp. Marseille-Q3903]|uniref:hypothetical protein n=1 Tax=Treponema sp. Marseille-Q3903 TaxID=2766703 RepID=UPI00165233E6|nr:hypothetical protein [Treponema sp. Marseille-Q3903]MBC6712403.1 hypothetical protein [Treponema sp. Marseille-Q3903]